MKEQYEFVAIWCRACFYLTMGLFGIAITLQDNLLQSPVSPLYIFVWIGASIATFVLSIIHLIKYKEKAFAITALVLSSLLNIAFFAGIIVGMMEMI